MKFQLRNKPFIAFSIVAAVGMRGKTARADLIDQLGYATYHEYYEGQSLTTVACSDGVNGLMTRFGYSTIDPMSPYVTATSNVVWNSDKCGVCYAVKSDYNGGTTVYVTAIDGSGGSPDPDALHFDLHPVAFKELLGDEGVAAGSSYVTYEEVDYQFCKGNLGGGAPNPSPGGDDDDGNKCCLVGETRMKAYNDCTQYYHCVDGSVLPGVIGPNPNGLLFDEDLQNWNFADLVTCDANPCGSSDGESPSTPSPTLSPTPSPTPSPTTPTSSSDNNDIMCCLPGETKMKAYNECTAFYHCVNGSVFPGAVAPGAPGLLLFDEGIQNWNYANLVSCSSSVDDPCASHNNGTRRKNLRV